MSGNTYNICFFGCWNVGCAESTGQRQLTNEIIKRKEQFNKLIVAGDNVYPVKTDKSASAVIAIIQTGFNCLNSIDIDTSIILGNHDAEQTNPGPEPGPGPKPICMSDIQKSHATGKMHIHDTVTHEQIDCGNFKVNLIYTNTNHFVDDKEYKKLNCYEPSTKQQIEFDQINKIRQMVDYSDNTYNFIIGHHPIFYLLHKEPWTMNDSGLKMNFLVMMKEISIQLATHGKRLYYLCADEHLYQHFDCLNLTQIISGTGGANLDPAQSLGNQYLVGNKKHPFCENTIKYGAGISSYGYVSINIDEIGVTLKFNALSDLVESIEQKGESIKYNSDNQLEDHVSGLLIPQPKITLGGNLSDNKYYIKY